MRRSCVLLEPQTVLAVTGCDLSAHHAQEYETLEGMSAQGRREQLVPAHAHRERAGRLLCSLGFQFEKRIVCTTARLQWELLTLSSFILGRN